MKKPSCDLLAHHLLALETAQATVTKISADLRTEMDRLIHRAAAEVCKACDVLPGGEVLDAARMGDYLDDALSDGFFSPLGRLATAIEEVKREVGE